MKKIIINTVILLSSYATHAAVTELTDALFTDATSDGNVLVKFYAPYCPPCKMSKPVLERLSNQPEYANVQFYEVNIDGQNEMAASKFQVSSMPTFVFLKDGREIDRIVGFDERSLQRNLHEYFGAEQSSMKKMPAAPGGPQEESSITEEELINMMPEMNEEAASMPAPEHESHQPWYTPLVDFFQGIINFFKGIYYRIYNFMFR